MTLTQALHAFFSDLKLQTAAAIILLDFVLGVLAALKQGTFRLSYLTDFARTDLAFKLVPWAVIYVGAKLAGSQQIVIPGLDLNVIATAIFVGLVAAWTGSILSSLAELGFNVAAGLPHSLRGPENAAPPKD